MTDQLPAHLQTRNRPAMLQDAMAGLSAGRGPHVSTESNRFTLVDAAGNKKPIQTLYLDVVVVDVNPKPSRVYYDPTKPYNGEGTAPLCFSDNGIGASAQAQSPQHHSCQLCPKSDWGSAVAMSGGTKPACGNGKKLAVIAGGTGDMVFSLKVPPMSLKNWLAYCKFLQQRGIEPYDVYTRVEFESQGVLKFYEAPIGDKGLAYVDQSIIDLTEKLWQTNATVEATNKNDIPWTGQGDAQKAAYAAQNAAQLPAPPAPQAAPAPLAPPPQPFGQPLPVGSTPAPFAANTPMPTAPAFGTSTAPLAQPGTSSPTDATPAKRGRGPNKPKPDATPAPNGPSPTPFGGGAADGLGIPPFLQRNASPPPAPEMPSVNTFGMNPNPPAPDAGVQAALDAAFRLPT